MSKIALACHFVEASCSQNFSQRLGLTAAPFREVTSVSDAFEEWRPVLGFEGFYEVSSYGRVRSLDRRIVASTGRVSNLRGRVLKQKLNHNYLKVNLHMPQKVRYACVHRLVCEAFHGASPSWDSVVRHLNGQRLDNRPENLRWGTAAENTADMISHGNAYWSNQTECIRGHEFTPENTYVRVKLDGLKVRVCRECKRQRPRPPRRKPKEQRTCVVCGETFLTAYSRVKCCSKDCNRISRRREFGWSPKESAA